jgi:predicted nucleotidyltransferase
VRLYISEVTEIPTVSPKARHNEAMAIALTPQQQEAITEACRRHQVARMHAFGSIVGPHYQPAVSDIDLLGNSSPAKRDLCTKPISVS